MQYNLIDSGNELGKKTKFLETVILNAWVAKNRFTMTYFIADFKQNATRKDTKHT